MPLFAISDVVWQALIAALLTGYLEWSRRKTATKVEEVAKTAEVVAVKVSEVADKVEVVRHATNSLTEQLVRSTNTAALLEGEKVGRAAQKAENGLQAHS